MTGYSSGTLDGRPVDSLRLYRTLVGAYYAGQLDGNVVYGTYQHGEVLI